MLVLPLMPLLDGPCAGGCLASLVTASRSVPVIAMGDGSVVALIAAVVGDTCRPRRAFVYP